MVERGVDAFGTGTLGGLQHAAALDGIGVLDAGDGAMEALAGLSGQLLQRGVIRGDGFEGFDRGEKALE